MQKPAVRTVFSTEGPRRPDVSGRAFQSHFNMLRILPSSSEPQQHPALHPEPEGGRQPAQTNAAIQNPRVLERLRAKD